MGFSAYNTLVSLQKTEANMAKCEGQLDCTLVESNDNVAETATAFAAQSQQFKQAQTQFEEYMDRLQDDIHEKGEKFGHVEYYDAKLRDGHSNEEAIAASEVNQLDSRRKPLAAANPLLAKKADIPPAPNVDDITFEYLQLDLPAIAENALNDLNTIGRINDDPSTSPDGDTEPQLQEEPLTYDQDSVSEESSDFSESNPDEIQSDGSSVSEDENDDENNK